MPLILLGAVLSLLWCWAGWYYLEEAIGFANLLLFLPHEIGQFMVGFFTPLFLLWILIVLFVLMRRVGRIAAPPASDSGGFEGRSRPRERQINMVSAPSVTPPSPAPGKDTPGTDTPEKARPTTTVTPQVAAPKSATQEKPAQQAAASPDTSVSSAPRPKKEQPSAKRARASASVTLSDAQGKTATRKSEESVSTGDGPAIASARAVGRSETAAPESSSAASALDASAKYPPKRPAAPPLAAPPLAASTATPPEAKHPPKRPASAMPSENSPEAEEASAGGSSGTLPPKRPREENVAPMPRSAGGVLPPKNPKNQTEDYAAAERRTVKELNAIAMDAAASICDPQAYHESRAALNGGQSDSFFTCCWPSWSKAARKPSTSCAGTET